jgi:thioredoxin 1
MALEITDATFEEVVLKSDKPVMVDFWAAWCGPCRMVGPIIDEISQDFDGKAVVGKVDVDANQEFAAKYGVRNIPTVLVFDKGELVGRHVGVSPKAAYAEALDAVVYLSIQYPFSFCWFCLANTKWGVYLHTLIKVW